MFRLSEAAEPHERLDHSEDAGADVQRVTRSLCSEDCTISSDPCGVGFPLPDEGRRQCLVGPGEQQVQLDLVLFGCSAGGLFEVGEQLHGEDADLRQSPRMGQLPEVFDVTAQCVDRPALAFCRAGQQRAEGRVAGDQASCLVQVIGQRERGGSR
ncbi:hypothetical protein M878_46115 (plasmid) [Streptomyces roseochromogenus subsp. oscitans DS 12.976]|uniref:Uncharacterized protein n=1 Tax=Streptomyces roseochromogenus subsp. oscitans DS 12.976 TaxID=1352936 RepID=V6JDR8_STRRC|nr:hypothetical protein M878_46115 [Streptomyces roseochromogenus subsp. oscitans DS 12.976]